MIAIRNATGLDAAEVEKLQNFYSPTNPNRTFGIGLVNHFHSVSDLTRIVNPFFLLAVKQDKEKESEKILGYALAYDRERIQSFRNGHSASLIHQKILNLNIEGNFLYLDHLVLIPKLYPKSPLIPSYLETRLVEKARDSNIRELYTTINTSPERNEDIIKIVEILKWKSKEVTIRDETGRECMVYYKDLNHA